MRREAFLNGWPWLVGLAGLAALMLLQDAGSEPLNLLLIRLPGVDKVLHTIQSIAIFALVYWALGRTRLSGQRRLFCSAAITLAVAALDELQQTLAPGRSVEAADLFAAASGVIIAAAGAWMLASGPSVRAYSAAALGILLSASITLDSFAKTKDFNRGLILAGRGDLAGAHQSYLEALKHGQVHAELYNSLAWTGVESGTIAAATAVQYAEQSLALEPRNADALDTYGWALHHAQRDQEALEALLSALQLNPLIYCVHYHLGAVYAALGQLDKAQEHLQKQIVMFPATQEAERAAALLEQTGLRSATTSRHGH